MRKLAIAAVALASFAVASFAFLPALIEASLDRVRMKPPYRAPQWTRELLRDSIDLHADPLLWGRDLLERGSRGHVDVPRLQEAGALVQVLGVVTQAPVSMSFSAANREHAPDLVTALAILSRWPRPTWTSRRARALYEAHRLHDIMDRSDGRLVPVLSKKDLYALIEARANGSRAVGALLALEGSQALEGDLSAIDALYDAGFRMMAPTHFVDTDISGSAHGKRKGGLTPVGREWLRRLEEKRIVVDIAHASPAAIADILARATRPLVVSHTGVRGTCDTQRNLSDSELGALARNGALVGIGYFAGAVCGSDPRAIARAFRYAADRIGVEHLAFGSDFDGAVTMPFDVTGLPLLVEAMRAERFTDADIRGIASQNAVRFLAQALP